MRKSRTTTAFMSHWLLTCPLLGLALAQQSDTPPPPGKTPEDFLVQGLEDVEPAFAGFEGDMYAGLLPTNDDIDQDGDPEEFMFWLFVPHQQTVPDTMVTWLNGGPGCSSILGGVLLENSPVNLGAHAAGTCCLDPNAPLQANPHSWTQATTMLYVELPTGVGFSRGGVEPTREDEIATAFYGFLQSFYKVFPNLLQNRLTLFGESYAGYYVPSMARKIALENDRQPTTMQPKIPLESIGLGNAWMDASLQGPAVIDYAWWHGMIDEFTRNEFHAEWKRCYELGEAVKPPFHPFTTTDECGILGAILAANGQNMLPEGRTPNAYDVTTFDPYAVIADTNSTLTRFMNHPRVKQALHAPANVTWQGCIEGGGRRRLALLDHDKPLSVLPYVAELLDRWNLRVLVYNGDLDMSVNSVGSERLINNLHWSGHRAWKVAGRGIWMAQSAVAGYVKKYSNLTFLVVKNSGHMVPLNQPEAALDMVERFLLNVPFLDIPLPSFVLSDTAAWTDRSHTPAPSAQMLLPSEEPAYECQNSMWLRIVDQFIVAMVCFMAGAIAAHSWRHKGYEAVSTSPRANGLSMH